MMSNSGRRRVVVVTGASAGVGRATVRRFASAGADIALLARGKERLEATRREVEEMGCRALVLPTDVSDADQVEAAAAATEEQLGPIDVWVNNAMVTVVAPIKETSPEEFRRVTEVTYLGYVHGTLAALKRMLPRDRGVIIQVGSALAYRGIPLQAPYCGAKHAIQGFNDSLRAELLHDNSKVAVSSVHLPAVNTPQFEWTRSHMPRKSQPVPPIFQPEVAAEAIFWMSEQPRREIYVGFSAAKAIIGNKIAPGLGDWYLSRNGVESQMIDEPADPDRPHNLWEPVAGDFGARGPFSDRASDWSLQLWASMHRGELVTALGAVLATAAAGISWLRTRQA
jgi:NAD(P)-dependent dehydrogenase (short-subunit alcohol dehydrogenase family)